MKYSFISDVHIREANDDASKLLLSFLYHKSTVESDYIIFLGDIFDLLIGEHKGYIQKYSFFFKEIVKLLDSGKKIIYIEGNHDFHFKNTIKKYLDKYTKNSHNFEYREAGIVIDFDNTRILCCHGYEVDYYNKSFKRWHYIYTSRVFKFYLSKLLTFSFIQRFGDWATNNSKKRGSKSFNYEDSKKKYIKGAKELIKERSINGVIAGHTHVDEFCTFEDGTTYFNNGFPLSNNHFIHYDGKIFKKVNLLNN